MDGAQIGRITDLSSDKPRFGGMDRLSNGPELRTAVPMPQPEIFRELDVCDSLTDTLLGQLTQLGQQLEPVLMPYPKGSDPVAKAELGSSIGGRVNTMNNRVAHAIELIRIYRDNLAI